MKHFWARTFFRVFGLNVWYKRGLLLYSVSSLLCFLITNCCHRLFGCSRSVPAIFLSIFIRASRCWSKNSINSQNIRQGPTIRTLLLCCKMWQHRADESSFFCRAKCICFLFVVFICLDGVFRIFCTWRTQLRNVLYSIFCSFLRSVVLYINILSSYRICS